MLASLRLRLPPRLAGIVPLLVCWLVFLPGLFTWFQQDDFSWLRLEMHSWGDFWKLLVEPRAQGTIRPLSERFFFILFRRLFGLDAFPYRLFVFLTQSANLLLLLALARKLTGSRVVAAGASLLWTLNIALVAPMTWTSAYNQILCSFFLLGALLLFVKHVETGRWPYYWGQWAVFVLGFGALEIAVVYPVVALAFCLLLAPGHAWKALPLGLVSVVYAAARLWGIPRAAAGPYILHFDLSIVRGLFEYWGWVLGPTQLAKLVPAGRGAAVVLVLVMSIGLLAAMLLVETRRRRVAVFGLIWFVATLAPVLPLRDHRLDYYLTIPAIGLALAVSAALGALPRPLAFAWVAIYAACSLPVLLHGVRSQYERGESARLFIDGVSRIRAAHPDKTILLTGVTESLFYAVMYDEGPLTAGIHSVYLTPDHPPIPSRPGLAPVSQYQLPPSATLDALKRKAAVVYEVAGARFQNITSAYTLLASKTLERAPPRRVLVAEPAMTGQLDEGWYEIQGAHRWMGRRAGLRLAGPRSARERLHMEAHSSAHPNAGTVELTVYVNGVVAGRAQVRNGSSHRLVFPLPASVIGAAEIRVILETDRTFRAPPDPRDLGLAFSVIELIE